MKKGVTTSDKGRAGFSDVQASVGTFILGGTSTNTSNEVKYKKQYISWNKEMDNHLAKVLTDQMAQGNKCDGDTWKPQALQAASHPDAKGMQNKMIEHWDDIVLLCGKDRAMGQGTETFEEGVEAMAEEEETEVNSAPVTGARTRPSSSTDSMPNKKKKLKKDSLVEAIGTIATSFQEFLASKKKNEEKPNGIETHEVVSMIPGLTSHEVFKAVRKGSPSTSVVACSSDVDVLVAPSGDLFGQPIGLSPLVVMEVASGDTLAVAPLAEGASAANPELAASGYQEFEVAEDAGPSKKCRCKHKKHSSKSSSKSSKRSKSRSERRATKDTAEEEENTNMLKELMVWWKEAREDLKAPHAKVAKMEGEKMNLDWAISARSSVLRTHVGQDSWGLYKACYLDCNQSLFAQTTHTGVEEHHAHTLMHAITSGHSLSMKRSTYRHQKAVAELKVHDLLKDLDGTKERENEANDAKLELEAKIIDLEAQLQQKTGLIEGCDTYIRSDEYKSEVSKILLQGALDFLKALTFKMAIETQSSGFLNEGFDKCIFEGNHLKGFADGFDQSRLDPSLMLSFSLTVMKRL
ncbi:hypothetical protein Salat_2527900 [Sesamum alatum]|uniref:Uncharacterized protein n=1 Tax=Sesamum alatum TaxID=300844 RepID=A0AAE1XRZ9_9LAMI|nr:hypothetical protein Salat_2527900 [Sesamum alatum]